jgi:hypothetical protein
MQLFEIKIDIPVQPGALERAGGKGDDKEERREGLPRTTRKARIRTGLRRNDIDRKPMARA